MVRIFPKAADQAKITTLKGALFCQILLQEGKEYYHGEQEPYSRSNIKRPTPGRNPTKPVITAPSHSNGIQQSEE